MNKLITTDLGGQPLYYKDFEFIQEQIRSSAKASFGHLDSDIVNILNGAEFELSTDGYTIDVTSEGWAWYNGEYYYIPIQSATGATPNLLKWYIEKTYDARGLKTFEDDTVGEKDVYQVNVLKLNYVPSTIVAPLFSETGNAQIVQSTEEKQGIIQLATEAEVLAGTDEEKAVTPATLRSLEATSSEVIEGVENKYITPSVLTEEWKEVGNDGGITSKYAPYNGVNNLSYYRRNGNNLEVYVKSFQPTSDTSISVLFLFNSGFFKTYIEQFSSGIMGSGAISYRESSNPFRLGGTGLPRYRNYTAGAGIGFTKTGNTQDDISSANVSAGSLFIFPIDLPVF